MSYTLLIDGEQRTYDTPMKLLDLLPEQDKKKYYAARVDRRVRPLTYEINEDAIITWLDLSDRQACQFYENSLRYLICMAFYRLYPKAKIRLSYNVSRSIFLEILDKSIQVNMNLVEEIRAKMEEIVKEDYPLVLKRCSKEEITEIYKEEGYDDKVEILPYRPEEICHYHECDGYKNYMYGQLVPSTGYISKWQMRLYLPGILFQYPRYETKGEIPPFQDAPIFGKVLKEMHNWGRIAGADSIAGINKHIDQDGSIDFINMCEARHNKMFVELGDQIEENIDNIRLICIAGPSSSGKTTFANRLRTELLSRGIRPIRISIDDYYLPRSLAPKDEHGEPDLESIYALDIDLFNKNMADLISGLEVELPKFDFMLGKRVKGRKLSVAPDEPIIIEGIHALNEKLTNLIPKHQKFKIYIAPQAQINIDNHNPLSLTDLRLLRRIIRDNRTRNASAIDTIKMWPSVRMGEFKWIYDTQEGANYVFNSLLSYEISAMKKYAIPLLNNVDRNSEFYPMVERLIRTYKFFEQIDDKFIPCNSLMREFIGGSCYEGE